MRLIWSIVIGSCLIDPCVGYMMSIKDSYIIEFFNFPATIKLEESCKAELNAISSKFISNDSLKYQYSRYYETFSFGRSNEFVGESRWLHNFLECFTVKDALPKRRSYCYGYNKFLETDQDAYGICIPSKCSNDHRELLERWKTIIANNTQPFDYVECTNSWHEKPWYQTPATLMQISFNIVLFTVIAIATYYHRRNENSRSLKSQMLHAFSLKRNLQRLIQFPKDSQTTITCLFGLRFMSMVWTLIGHCFAWIQGYVENIGDLKKDMTDDFSSLWITNFNLSVDTFFVISATLTSYSWFRNMTKNDNNISWKSWCYWLSFYRHRLIRLWPAYLITLTDITYWLSMMHTHPMWPPSDPSVQCRQTGWQNVFFLNSIFSSDCMGWTWYIGTEFIFYLLAPIFLLSLKRSPHFGLSVALITIGISNSLKILVLVKNNYPPIPLNFRESTVFAGSFMEQVNAYYIKPQYRISPYIIGLLLGYGLVKVQNLKNQKQHSLLFQSTAWMFALLLGCWALLGVHPTMLDLNVPVINLVYGATHRTAWALFVAWIIYACHIGIGGVINKFLSWWPFLPLSSLCYSVYLIHLIIVFATFMWSPFPMVYTGKLPILMYCFLQLVISYAAALLISTAVEFPVLNLERLFLHRKVTKEKIIFENNKVFEVLLQQVK